MEVLLLSVRRSVILLLMLLVAVMALPSVLLGSFVHISIRGYICGVELTKKLLKAIEDLIDRS